MTATSVTAVVLDGETLRDADGEVIAALIASEWRTPDGAVITELAFDLPVVRAHVTTGARRDADASWLDGALRDVYALALRAEDFTADDVWAALTMPPREARQLGGLLARAKARGWVVPTDAHRPSTRGLNHSRPVRVWRSTIHGS